MWRTIISILTLFWCWASFKISSAQEEHFQMTKCTLVDNMRFRTWLILLGHLNIEKKRIWLKVKLYWLILIFEVLTLTNQGSIKLANVTALVQVRQRSSVCHNCGRRQLDRRRNRIVDAEPSLSSGCPICDNAQGASPNLWVISQS